MNYIVRMRNLREDSDLTQQEIATVLGTSQTMYARYERGANELPIRHLIVLAKYYDVSTDYLLKESMEEDTVLRKEGFGDIQDEDSHSTHIVIQKSMMAFEYKSQKNWRGMPLVHVNIGLGRCAKGVIAIGLVSKGIVAIGLAGLGVVTLAPIGIGLLLAVGGMVLGGIAVGSFAVGIVAMGAVCLGLFPWALWQWGSLASAPWRSDNRLPIGDSAHGDIALGFSEASGRIFEQVTGVDGSFDYQGMLKAVDENVAGHWFIFKEWVKGIIHLMAKV